MFDLKPFFVKHHLDLTAPIVVAFSGGCDSLALLYLLVQQFGPAQVSALYVNHALRPRKELEREITLNIDNCRRLKVPLEIVTLAPGEVEAVAKERQGGVEEAARHLRRQALEAYRKTKNVRYIATGHTIDDQAETVLMNLLHGGSFTGPKGIRAVMYPYIRPLLELRKESLIALLNAQNFKWSEDSTNKEHLYRRNQIRHQVIPVLAQQQPAYREMLARMGEQSVLVHDYLVEQALLYEEDVFSVQGSALAVNLSAYRALNQAVRYQLLYRAWNRLQRQSGESSAQRWPYEHVQRGDDFLMDDGEVGKQLDLALCYFIREHQRVLISKSVADAMSVTPPPFELPLSEQRFWFQTIPWHENWMLIRARVAQPKGKILEELWHNPLTIWLDESTLQGVLTLRGGEPSERVELAEGSKSLGKLYNGWKIPRSLWPLIPVLALNEEIIAVLGNAFGGRDRICRRMRNNGKLDRKGLTLYSVIVDKD